jgi:TolB-like protein
MSKRIIALFLFAAVLIGMAAAKDTLAVLPFTGGTKEEGETIAELFSFSNELNAVFAPIPRTSISRAISNEQNFQMGTGMTDPDTIAAIGKQLGAKYVVAGNIAKLGDHNLLLISILKIDDLRQIAGDLQTYTKIEEIQDKLPEMARKIIGATQINSDKLEKLAVVPVELGNNIDSRIADTLAQILSINLINSGMYAVYPRTATLEQVQAEYSTQTSGITADESVVNIGKGDNPRFVLSVVARRLGSRNMFNASIINLESGVQLIGRSANYNTLNDGIEAMGNLTREMTGGAASSDSALEEIRKAADNSKPVNTPSSSSPAKPAEKTGGPPAEKTAKKGGGGAFGYGVLNLAVGLGSFVQKDPGGGITLLLFYGAAAGLVGYELTLSYTDPLAGIPGTVGIGVGAVAVLYGFIRPFVFNKKHSLAGIMDGVNIAVVPEDQGSRAVRLSYTLKF